MIAIVEQYMMIHHGVGAQHSSILFIQIQAVRKDARTLPFMVRANCSATRRLEVRHGANYPTHVLVSRRM